MEDRFREMEIMRGARCVQGAELVYVELKEGWEEHFHDGGMRGCYWFDREPRISASDRTRAALRGESWPAAPVKVYSPNKRPRPWWRFWRRNG